jgi:hypothetical protein
MGVQYRRQEIPGGDFGIGVVMERCFRRVSRGKGVTALEGDTSSVEGQDVYRFEPVKWLPSRIEP